MVLFGHLIMLFWPHVVAPEIYPARVTAQETYLAFSPLSLLWDGRLAVPIFFVLSGYVLTASVTGARRPLVFPALVAKRYLRLALPVLASSVLALLLIPAGLYYLPEVALVTGSRWLETTLPPDFQPTVAAWLGESLWSTFFAYRESYFNPALWTLHYEFEGSLLCYLLCRLLPDPRRRALATLLLLAGCGLAERALPLHLFMAGTLLHDAPQLIAWRPSPRLGNAAGLLLILGGVVLPRLLAILPGTVAWPFLLRAWLAAALPFWRGDRFTTAAAMTVAGLCLAPLLRSLLARPVFRFLGAISFPLYLTHLPVQFSAACFAFLWLAGRMAETPAALATMAVGATLALAVATLATRLIEQPSLAASRRAGIWLDRLWRGRIGSSSAGS